MKYHFKIYKEDKGYWAECLEIKGCSTQGNSIDELEANMSEALNLFLSESDSSTQIFPAPKKFHGRDIAAIEVDPGVYLAMSIRQERLKKNMTQKQMMQTLGIKTLSNYQRLENPKRANPELRTLVSLKKAIPELKISRIFETQKTKKSRAG